MTMRAPSSSTTQRVPGAPAVMMMGARLAQIIDIALKRRRMLELRGCSRVTAAALNVSRMKLEAWRTVNRSPWPATVRAFRFMADLQLVMPSNAEGKKLMAEAEELVANA